MKDKIERWILIKLNLESCLFCFFSDSPNTPGLRALQADKHLSGILSTVRAAKEEMEAKLGRKVPLVVKVSPDLTGDEISSMARTFSDEKVKLFCFTLL
jgi:dihydroorotate dehydrogenase